MLKKIKKSERFAKVFDYFQNFEKKNLNEFQFCLKFYQNLKKYCFAKKAQNKTNNEAPIYQNP